uniref:Uncharacterized protein n=1 Tax=Solibacter usitatus (strain Ellin6076) TaxID=234267 RepID=Q01V66_SOLUE
MAKVRIALLTLIAVAVLRAQVRPTRIDLNDPRPVAMAAVELERHLGWVVTYEDPAWLAQSEVKDVTESVRSDMQSMPAFMRNLIPRVLVPKGGSFSFELPSGPMARGGRVNAVNDILTAHTSSGNPGVFRAQEGASGRLHIIPMVARDRSGQLVAQQPILSRPITVPSRQYQGLEFLGAFTEELARSTGVDVQIGTVPLNTFVHHTGTYGAANEPAREALSRFLDGVGDSYSWQLFFDPVDRNYVLNIHSVDTKGRLPR